MARTPAVTGASNKLIRSMRQRQANIGERLTPDEIRAIVSGELDVEARRSLQGAQLEEQKRQFDIQNKRAEEAQAANERSAAISGGAQLAGLGYKAAVQAPAERAFMQSQANYYNTLADKISGGTTTAQAVGGGALPATAVGAAGETGLSVAGSAIPETFVSGTTGQTVSTATGEAVAGGAGTLGTIAGGAGAFGAGQLGNSLIGEGGVFQVGGGKGAEAAGVAGGIAAGAAYGSVIPGIGTVVGGVLGGLGAAADGTVICTELRRQGYLDRRVVAYDYVYRIYNIDGEAYFGYKLWAEPLVLRMQESKLITQMVRPFGVAWAHTMANKVNPEIKVTPIQKWVGEKLLKYGIPFCRKKARGILKKSEVVYG